MSVLVWRLAGTNGDGVNDTPSSQDLRIRCDELPMTSFSVLVHPVSKVNQITPRCTCEGHGLHVCGVEAGSLGFGDGVNDFAYAQKAMSVSL